MKSLRKNFWPFLASILAILGILAAYHIYTLAKPVKSLQIRIDAPISLVNINPEILNDIQVLYKGSLVNNVSFLQIQLKNDGNQPVVETDYNRPISISISPKYKLLDVSVTGTTPANLGITTEQSSDNSVKIKPVLLNPGDDATIRFTIVGSPSIAISDGVVIDGRIVGVKQIDVITPDNPPSRTQKFVLISIGGIVGAIMVYLFSIIAFRKQVLNEIQLEDELTQLKAQLLLQKEQIEKDLIVYRATYGARDKYIDVTSVLRNNIVNGKLDMLVDNNSLGCDPIKKVPKELRVDYSYDGKPSSIIIPEGEPLILPPK